MAIVLFSLTSFCLSLRSECPFVCHVGGVDWGFFDACVVKINEIQSGPSTVPSGWFINKMDGTTCG